MISCSPSCNSRPAKSIERRWIRGGVPVLKRCNRKPSARSDSVNGFAAAMPSGPLSRAYSPMIIRPPRNVPDAMITAFAGWRAPIAVTTADTAPFSVSTETTSSCISCKPSCCSSACFIYVRYLTRSACARSECTAGPLPRLSMRYWIQAASAARAISPPNASISRTKCPFAVPPIAGLHGILPTASRLIVKHAVFIPRRAAASAASIPACPAPTTTTSKASAGKTVMNPPPSSYVTETHRQKVDKPTFIHTC